MKTANIEKVGFFDSKISFPNTRVTPKRHVKFYEIELYTEPGGTTILDGRRHEIRKGMLLIAKPNQIRNSILHFKAYYTHLDTSDPLVNSFLDELPDVVRILNFELCASLFTSMIRDQNSQGSAKCLALKSKLYELVHLIYTSNQNKRVQNVEGDESHFELVTEIANYIDRNFDREISLESLAERANLSPIYFHKLFKQYLGKTPHKYLLERRIEAAKALLRSTNLPVTTIAFETGFNSQSHFNYTFKKLTKLTPLQFRKRNASPYPISEEDYGQ